MGLVLVCPQCRAKVEISAQNCQYCHADLRQLPRAQRVYSTEPAGPPPAPEAPPQAIPVLESAGVPETVAAPLVAPPTRVRRPYIRRYAGEPAAATCPSSLTAAKTEAAPPAGRIRRPYIRRFAGEPVALTHPSTLSKSAPAPKAEAKKTKKGKATSKKKK
jgi:hypothetical protein